MVEKLSRTIFVYPTVFDAVFLVFSIDYTTTGLAGWILVSCIGLFIVAFSVKDYLVKKKMKYILLSIFVSSISSLVLIMGLWIITTLTSNMGN